ncbi:MAG: molybdopterin-dependent oxidoreductase [Gammaproteobacteria bacterium]|nr:molybdopterin-dependent oxidoreductase [Gammaproteobacteria bacterium]
MSNLNPKLSTGAPGAVNVQPIVALNRRELIAAAGALLAAPAFGVRMAFAEEGPQTMNVWVTLDEQGTATVLCPVADMGQGIIHSLPLILAEEMEVDWEQVQVRYAPLNPPVYGNPGRFDHGQGSGNSISVMGYHTRLRQAGAAAREMLIAAAAAQWGVAPAECRAEQSRVWHGDRSMGYGELAASAAKMAAPEDPPLKSPDQFRLIGKHAPRKDSAPKVDGSFAFMADFAGGEPALRAAVVNAPRPGARLKSLSTANANGGWPRVFAIGENAVAAVAEDYWTASSALEQAEIDWEGGDTSSTETVFDELHRALSADDARVFIEGGDPDGALAAAEFSLDETYEAPILAHATMEPLGATARLQGDGCEIWIPSQNLQRLSADIGNAFDMQPEDLTLHPCNMGGAFGRRIESEIAIQAVAIAKALRAQGLPDQPVRLVWSREEDMRNDCYRPPYVARLRAALNTEGLPVAWTGTVAGHSLLYERWPWMVEETADASSAGALFNDLYSIPNRRITHVMRQMPVRGGFWRSVASSMNSFFAESFLDEVAHAGGRGPVELRAELAAGDPRALRVLEATVQGWTPQSGIALAKLFASYIGMQIDLGVEDGEWRAQRIRAVVDCGLAVDPNNIEAQIEGAIVYGLTAVLLGEINLEDGAVVEGNFDRYRMLTMAQVPPMEVVVIESDAPPTGIGELGTPLVAPAFCNALFAATGRRVRKLPLRAEDLSA